ncbi:zinc finger protein 557-like [Argopecten irradians]|uniref:zinc finger protein 557-like n=1 Tax=Argopecten irradians TaxID=31199 RepID=UPI003714021E
MLLIAKDYANTDQLCYIYTTEIWSCFLLLIVLIAEGNSDHVLYYIYPIGNMARQQRISRIRQEGQKGQTTSRRDRLKEAKKAEKEKMVKQEKIQILETNGTNLVRNVVPSYSNTPKIYHRNGMANVTNGSYTRRMTTRAMSRSLDVGSGLESKTKWTAFEIKHLRRVVNIIQKNHPNVWEIVQGIVVAETKKKYQQQNKKGLKTRQNLEETTTVPGTENQVDVLKRKLPRVLGLHVADNDQQDSYEVKRRNLVDCSRKDWNDGTRQKSVGQSQLSDPQPYSCYHCGKGFNDKRCMRKHVRAHTRDKNCKCQLCGKLFQTKSDMRTHVRIHSGTQLHRCGTCGKGFNVKMDLHRHRRTHTGEKPFPCSQCDRRFIDQRDLRKHLKTHFRQERYACDICGKSFTRKFSLAVHIQGHSGDRTFSCDDCDKRFSSQENLRKHLKTHSGEKPHKCVQCGKSFSRKYSLNIHLRVHKSEKLYKCDTCSKTFLYRNSFRRHTLIHTRGNNS